MTHTPAKATAAHRHRHLTLSCGFEVFRLKTDLLCDRSKATFAETCGRKSLRDTGALSVVGLRHLLANVVLERRTPSWRIRRGDPTERHGLLRPTGPTVRQGVVGELLQEEGLGLLGGASGSGTGHGKLLSSRG